MMCETWDLDVVRRRYRAEELQELFRKSVSSMRYDARRKRFVSTVEQKHPIYRALYHLIERLNFSSRRRVRQRHWLVSVMERVRCGLIPGASARETGQLIRLKNSLVNHSRVKAHARLAAAEVPAAPVTGTTLAELSTALVTLVVDHRLTDTQVLPLAVQRVAGERRPVAVAHYVLAPPAPFPVRLFEPRVYTLPAPRTIPMPEPSYCDDLGHAPAKNRHIAEGRTAAWSPRRASRVSFWHVTPTQPNRTEQKKDISLKKSLFKRNSPQV